MPATGKADNAVTFTFDKPTGPLDVAALTAAIETEAGGKLSDDTAQAAAVVAEPAKAADPAPAAAAADPEPAKPATPASDDLKTFKITVDGQELEVTEADLKAGHMRHRDYTQKTQALAAEKTRITAQEREWATREAEYRNQLAAIDQFLRDKQAVDAYRTKAFGQATLQPPQIDPNKPLTVAEVAEIARYNAEQVRLATSQELDTRMAQQRQEIEQSRRAVQVEKLEASIDQHIDALLEQYPVLKKLGDRDDVSEELIGMASKFNPTSLDDAKLRLKEAAERKVANIRAIAEDEKKASAVQAARTKATSPEPPGGKAAAAPAPKKLSMDHKDRQARIDAGIADLQAFLNAQT
jgi:hypothetical protein